MGTNRAVPWPVSDKVFINNFRNISFHVDDLNNFQSYGIYFQNFRAKIFIGRGTYIGPNVGLITSNHDSNDITQHTSSHDIHIGEKCWIGMNSVLLPGIVLERGTIVGAGAIVTKSFHEENIVIAGNPAKIIKRISAEL